MSVVSSLAIVINAGEPMAGVMNIEQQWIDVTSLSGTVPDLRWEFVDAVGHYHAYDEDEKTPTLREVGYPIPHDDDCRNESHLNWDDETGEPDDEPLCPGWTRYETQCLVCGEQVAPRRRLEGEKHIPGRRDWTVTVPTHVADGERVSVKVTTPAATFFGFGQSARSRIQIGAQPETELQCSPMARRAGVMTPKDKAVEVRHDTLPAAPGPLPPGSEPRPGPAKYRKLPVVIEAIEWTGGNFDAVVEFLGDEGFMGASVGPGFDRIEIGTLEGVITAQVGDWIIRGVKGEFYPCRDDIFAATYEPAPDPAAPNPAR